MNLKERITAFVKTGNFIREHFSGAWPAGHENLHQGLTELIKVAHQHNNWFIPKYVNHAISNIGAYLTEDDLNTLCGQIKANESKVVAVICAGNIPMVGWHDIMCVLLSGHKVMVKLSSDDNVLLPFFLKLLVFFEPRFEEDILFAPGKLGKFDAVIATGSNNTASHFRYYFGKYPHIIRQNRSSVAVIKGDETDDQLRALGTDIFMYFGLGCRNVNKLLVPNSYNFNRFFEAIVSFGEVVNNSKYGNNYDYQRALFLLEKQPFLDNNFLLLKESESLHAPVGVLYYQRFATENAVKSYLEEHKNEIQCITGGGFLPFGYSQQPVITEFADKINTISFLVNL